ncbi:Transmembrane GTPase Marf-like protein [Dinothrombium tinctorium]|uniref:Transmembrane GTPase Marf-like protein n=1 Tax=Dinothrombium tinctorium TaxID=1965070 RepID=A0A3S3QDD7_9ACAR|nr:Transmembrane GTPase Marf-like protein [Dinothrombium tinctorium]
MQAIFNRSLSTGAFANGTSMHENGSADPNTLLQPSDSPLKLFVLAKRKINDVFTNLHGYVKESKTFLSYHSKDVISSEDIAKVSHFEEKIIGIRDVLRRDHMKVAFFGRTSNGKSTVINAVLRQKILPSGMGHTTNCFLQVEGSDTSEGYLVLEENPHEKLSIESVSQLANALNSEKLGDSTCVKIFWPKSLCSLLMDDVVLVDSPGIDVSPNLDEWIDKYCLDADVFILVSNAESTLMQTEKAFFHKVNEKLSKPNIFILNNRWDAAASEPEYLDRVRKQHTNRNVAFLSEELNIVSEEEAKDRVFFVSAKEALQARMQQQKGEPLNSGALAEGFQLRYMEFEEFERKFEECLSKTAIKTKFNQHAERGKTVINQLGYILDSVHQKATELKNEKLKVRQELHDKFEFTQQQIQLMTNEVKHQICHLVEQVELKVCSALNEEIRRLSLLVSDFEKPFSSDPLVLSVYKKELHSHVERGLGSNLRARLSTALSCCVESAQKEMIERISTLIPQSEQQTQMLVNITPRQSFEILYRINCESLCADFQEDLEFRFSFGLISLVRRFTSGNMFRKSTLPKSLPSTAPQTPSNEVRIETSNSDLLYLAQRLSIAAPQSQTTIGALALGGFMVRTIGWRIIALTCGIYVLLYVYERCTWTNKAKERSFKKQYVNHATKKLKMIVDLTSANCSHQVQQELTSTFARLCHLVDETLSEMQLQIKELDKDIERLSECANNAKSIKNKACLIANELDNFIETYLCYDN